MTRRLLVKIVAVVVVAVFAVGIWLSGANVEAEWLRYYSSAVLAAMLVITIWDQWVWRLSLAQKFNRVPPDISGSWKGTLTSLWTDPSTGEKPSSIIVYLVVRQTASHVSVLLFADESMSRSSFARVSNDGVEVTLEYMYLNRPAARVENRSRMHFGSAILRVSGRPVVRLQGGYWTNRETRGEIEFTEHSTQIVDDYHQAEELFNAKV